MSSASLEQTPHGWRILDKDRGVWYLEYEFVPQGWANCVAIRLADGGVLVLSPARGVSEAARDDLRQLGEVRALVATNGFHYLGMDSWQEHFPQARCFAPSDAIPRIAKHSPKTGPLEPLSELQPLLGSVLLIREVPNTKCGELWAIVKPSSAADGAIFFVSDILANIPALPKKLLMRVMFKWFKSAPGYRVFHLGLAFIVKDKRAVLRQLLEDLKAFPPSAVVPAHGAPIVDGDVAERTEQLIQSVIQPA